MGTLIYEKVCVKGYENSQNNCLRFSLQWEKRTQIVAPSLEQLSDKYKL